MKRVKSRFLMVLAGIVLLSSLYGCSLLDQTSLFYKSVFSVIYEVVAYDTLTPVTSGNWKLLGTDKSGTITDGAFQITDLTEGVYTVQIWADGYGVTQLPVVVATNAANYGAQIQETDNQINAIAALYPKTGSVNIAVYKGANGGLASNVRIRIAFTGPINGETVFMNTAKTSGFTTLADDSVITITTGNIAITNVPAYTNIWVTSLPYDSNSDSKWDYALTTTITPETIMPSGNTKVAHIMNEFTKDNIDIAQTNVTLANGARVTGAPIYFEFLEPMNTALYEDTNKALVTVTLTNGTTAANEPVTFNWTTSTRLEISPVADELDRDATYTLTVMVTAADGRQQTFIYTNVDWDVTRVAPGATIADYIQNFVLNPSTTKFNYNSTTVPVKWDVLTTSDSYNLYAKDNHSNTKWVYVTSVADVDDVAGSVSTTVTLPGEFDYYTDDGVTTPFANGVTVSITVTPHNWTTPNVNDASLPVLTIGDNTAPTTTTANAGQDGAGDNSAGTTAVTLKFYVAFDEPMDISTPPTLVFENTAGVIKASAAVWHWGPINGSDDNDTTQGYWQLEVGAGADTTIGGIQKWKFDYTNVKDTSGNSLDTTSLPYSALTLVN